MGLMKSMDKKIMPLANLPYNKKARIVSFEGGYRLKQRLRVMGIREGRVIKIISKQLLKGALTIEVNSCQITMGRGMTQKIIVEVT